MVTDLEEFKDVLPKAGDRLAIKKLIQRVTTTEKVHLEFIPKSRNLENVHVKATQPFLMYVSILCPTAKSCRDS